MARRHNSKRTQTGHGTRRRRSKQAGENQSESGCQRKGHAFAARNLQVPDSIFVFLNRRPRGDDRIVRRTASFRGVADAIEPVAELCPQSKFRSAFQRAGTVPTRRGRGGLRDGTLSGRIYHVMLVLGLSVPPMWQHRICKKGLFGAVDDAVRLPSTRRFRNRSRIRYRSGTRSFSISRDGLLFDFERQRATSRGCGHPWHRRRVFSLVERPPRRFRGPEGYRRVEDDEGYTSVSSACYCLLFDLERLPAAGSRVRAPMASTACFFARGVPSTAFLRAGRVSTRRGRRGLCACTLGVLRPPFQSRETTGDEKRVRAPMASTACFFSRGAPSAAFPRAGTVPTRRGRVGLRVDTLGVLWSPFLFQETAGGVQVALVERPPRCF
jgi:hypothetical protein